MKSICMKNLWCLLPLLAGCQTKEVKEGVASYTGFPQRIELKAETIPTDTVLLRYAYRVRVSGHQAILFDLHSDENHFHLFSYPEMQYRGSFGKKGEAPEENTSLDDCRWKGNSLWTLDHARHELKGYQPADSLHASERIDLSASLQPLNFVWVDDTTLVVPDYMGECRLIWMNREGKLLRKTHSIPTDDVQRLQKHPAAMAQAWFSYLNYNPVNGILASVTQMGEVMQLFDLNSDKEIVVKGPKGEPQFEVSGKYAIPSGIMGFGEVQVGKKHIYASFNGTSFKEMMKADLEGKELPSGCNRIYVFNLKGEPVCEWVLNHSITGMYVDEERNQILATDVNQDEQIVRFDFPQIK